MIDKLSPCPFCGSAPALKDLAGWEIHCQCGADLCLPSPDKDEVTAAWNRRVALSLPDAAQDMQRSFYVVEHFVDGRSAGYWEGGGSRSFTTDIEKAVQFCRRNDAFWAIRGWHWGDIKITEHMMLAAPSAHPDAQPSGSEPMPGGPFATVGGLLAALKADDAQLVQDTVLTDREEAMIASIAEEAAPAESPHGADAPQDEPVVWADSALLNIFINPLNCRYQINMTLRRGELIADTDVALYTRPQVAAKSDEEIRDAARPFHSRVGGYTEFGERFNEVAFARALGIPAKGDA